MLCVVNNCNCTHTEVSTTLKKISIEGVFRRGGGAVGEKRAKIVSEDANAAI